MGQYLTAPVPSKSMPKGIPYIIGNEAAERFSFYGMKAILTIFMVEYLHLMGGQAGEAMPEPKSVEYYHLFTTAVYFTPLFGALIADAFFGKYRTIVTLSLVYCAGHACLAGMGIAGPAMWWLLAGLGLISIGSGGIKPCVSAHVGDQFGKSNSHLITRVFFWFYFSINLGSGVSTLLTPWLLEWYGPHVAFGIPGVLMGLATVAFWMGRRVFVHIPPGGEGFVREVFSRTGLQSLGKLFVIYLFVAVFWALFDQTGSSWVLQARDLDLNVDLGFWEGRLLPSQIQAVNPIFVMVLIVVFGFGVYPLIDRVWKLTPIRKIGMGLFVMVLGFAVVAWLQERIDAGERPTIWWQILAYLVLTSSEVMVSITALEFSYTQAPRRMKSMVMSVFLVSVSLGNVFTAQVNNFIQVPSGTSEASEIARRANSWLLDNLGDVGEGGKQALPTAKDVEVPDDARYELVDGGFTVVTAGHDEAFETEDDVTVTYLLNDEGSAFTRDAVVTRGIDEARAASEWIVADWRAQGRLPLTEQGQALIDGLTDPWGEQLVYTQLNRLEFRVLSPGPDRRAMTVWDVGIVGEIPDPDEAQDGGGAGGRVTWLAARKTELGVADDAQADEGAEPEADVEEFVGGRIKLQGASYFWFFTFVMLGAAVLFVPVGLAYKPQVYLQEEAPAEDAA